MSEVLKTQEVGSLAKPDWRVLPFREGRLEDEHIAQATAWAERLDLNPEEVEGVLRTEQAYLQQHGELSAQGAQTIKWYAAQQAVRLQEKAGLDIIYDGEQDRSEMYQDAIEKTAGTEPRGLVRVFDNRRFAKSAIVGRPSPLEPWHDAELERLQSLTDRQIKVPISGPYMLPDWSYDEYYTRSKKSGGRGLNQSEAKRQAVLDFAEQVIRPNVVSLLAGGADIIQIDEPALGARPGASSIGVEGFNAVTRDLLGKFSLHICFSKHDRLLPALSSLKNCWQISTEIANRDSRELGRDADHRPGFETLHGFRKHVPHIAVGLGVVSIHEDYIEPSELVRDRVLRAVDILGDPAKVFPSPDCGLRTRSWQVAYEKLCHVVEGTQLAKQALGV